MDHDSVRASTRRRFLAGLAAAGTAASGVATGFGVVDAGSLGGRVGDGGRALAENPTSRYDWPAFGQDSRNTCRTVSDGPEDGVRRGWTADVTATTPPAAVGGRIYVGTDAGLDALDAGTGERVWRAGTPSGVAAPPTVVDNTVYAGTSDGFVYAFRATGGERLWRYDAGGTAGPPPAADPGRDHLYVATGDGSVVGLDSRSGQPNWERSLDGTVESALAVLPATETVYVPVSGTVRGLDFANGSDRWTFEARGSTVSAPAVGSPHMFVADDEQRLYEVDPKSGEKRWSEPLSGSVREALAYLNDEVYVATDRGHVYAFDTDVSRNDDQASREWHVTLDGGVTTAPALSQGANTLYVPTDGGTVVALDPVEGGERWSATLSVGTPSIAVSDGSIFAVGEGVATLDPGSETRLTTETPTPGTSQTPTTTTPRATAGPRETPTRSATSTGTGTHSPTGTSIPGSTPGTTTRQPPAETASATLTETLPRSGPTSVAATGSSGDGTRTPATADLQGQAGKAATSPAGVGTTGGSGSLAPWTVLAAIGGLAALGVRSTDRDRHRDD